MSDKTDPARYRVAFTFGITERRSEYDNIPTLRVSIEEALPVGVDAEKYLRQRIGEEVRRNFANLRTPIDNAPEQDPLA